MTPSPSRRLSLMSLALSLLVLSATAAAQLPQVKQESEEEKAKARKELERKALLLLEETLAGAQVLKLPENRAAIRVQAADLFWTRDEKRARSLFRDAAADLAAAAARGQEGGRRDRSAWVLMQLRSQLLYTAAARDGQLALELLRDSRPAAEEGAQASPHDPDSELRLEQSIVAMSAESDPKVMLKTAEESLAKGVTFGVLGTLQRLHRKEPESATKLMHAVVERLRGQGLSGGREGFSVAISLLHMVLLPQASEPFLYVNNLPTPAPRPAEKPKPLVMEDGDLRELSDLVAAAALKDASANGAYGMMMSVRPLMPELEKRVPARAAQLRLRLAEMDKALDPHARAWARYDTLMGGSPETMVEEAAKAPDEMRAQLYSAAAVKLLQAGDTERARQVVSENLRGAEREQMLAHIDQTEVMRAVEKGDTDGAKAVASRIKSKERRARTLAGLAAAFALKGDRKTALQLLDEARGLVDRAPDNEREIEALLEVARGYALVEPSKTFELIDPLIDQANDMLAAAALLEKFGQGGGLFRKGEMIVSPGLSELGGAHARYVKALAELARVDFDRTRATADRFNRDETRLMARVVVARSVLSDRLGDPARPAEIFGGILSAR